MDTMEMLNKERNKATVYNLYNLKRRNRKIVSTGDTGIVEVYRND